LAQDNSTNQSQPPSNQPQGNRQQPETLPPTVIESPRTQQGSGGTPLTNAAPPSQGAETSGSAFTSAPATGYKADTNTTGAKIDLPNIDYPGRVDTVTQDTIRDQQAFFTPEILRNIPSAIFSGDPRRPDAFNVRGFEIRARDFRRNGFLDPTPEPRDFVNVDRVEVLQGPASALYGSGQPGGLINFITKRPVNGTFGVFNTTVGSFDFYREDVDVNTPILDGNVLFRLNAAYEHTNGWRDFTFGERTVVAPSFTWLMNDCTRLTFEYEHVESRRRFDSGVVAINGQVGVVPIRNFLGQPNDFFRNNVDRFTLFLDHQINDDWSWRIGGFVSMHDSSADATVPTIPANLFGGPDTLFLRQRQVIPDFSEQLFSVVSDLTGKFETGSLKHRVLIGSEFVRFNSTHFTSRFSDIIDPAFFTAVSPIDALNPQPFYGIPQPTALPGFYDADYISTRWGNYAQDIIEVSPHLKFLGAVRYDWANTTFERQFTPSFPPPPAAPTGFPFTRTETTNWRLTPKGGVVVEPVPERLSLYYTYSQSFDPPPGGLYANPDPLKAETGQIHEAGIKADLFDKRLSVFAAAFHIEKDNVVVENTNTLFATQVGRQRSQGVEVGAAGYLTDRWSIIANYAYVDARVTDDDNQGLIGNRLRNAAYNNANLWTRYDLIQGCNYTLGVAGGLVYVGNRPGDIENSFLLPGFTRLDAGLYFRKDRLNVAAYFENVLDREYYAGAANALSVFPGAPFNMRVTVGWAF